MKDVEFGRNLHVPSFRSFAHGKGIAPDTQQGTMIGSNDMTALHSNNSLFTASFQSDATQCSPTSLGRRALPPDLAPHIEVQPYSPYSVPSSMQRAPSSVHSTRSYSPRRLPRGSPMRMVSAGEYFSLRKDADQSSPSAAGLEQDSESLLLRDMIDCANQAAEWETCLERVTTNETGKGSIASVAQDTK